MLLFGLQFFSRTTRTAPRLLFSSSSLLGAASLYLASAISIISNTSNSPSFIVDAWTTTKASTFVSSSRSALCFSSSSSDMTASTTTPSSSSNTLIVAQVPCLSDNYGYLVHYGSSSELLLSGPLSCLLSSAILALKLIWYSDGVLFLPVELLEEVTNLLQKLPIF